MATKAPYVAIVPRTYAELRRSVMAVLIAGRKQVEAAWVLTYPETGRLIFVHELHKKERAGYGAKIYSQLSDGSAAQAERRLAAAGPVWRLMPPLGARENVRPFPSVESRVEKICACLFPQIPGERFLNARRLFRYFLRARHSVHK